MPTISQLPTVSTVTAGDALPVSQNGVTHAATIGTLLASTQPAILADSGTLLGRISLGPGGPESVAIGNGLMLTGATLQAVPLDCNGLAPAKNLANANSVLVSNGGGSPQLLGMNQLRGLFSAGSNIAIDATGVISSTGGGGTGTRSISTLPVTTAASAQDLVGISQAGADHAITYTNLINGQTIDAAPPAVAVSDGDSFWVAQGSNVMVAQTFSAIWPWIAAKLLTFKTPLVEITANTTIDGTVHNGRVLVCSQPVTLTPITTNMGNGFHCEVINLSGGTVSFTGSVISSSGVTTLASGQAATLRCLSYSGGTLLYVFMGNGGAATAAGAPGAASGLAATTATASSLLLSWQAPSTGGAATSYTLQYRVSGASPWTGSITGITGTSQAVTGLAAATSYDFCVIAVNAAGPGPASAAVTASTAVAAGAISSIVWNVGPSGSFTHGSGVIGVNAHVTPANGVVQFGFSTSATTPPSTWTAGSYVNTDLWGAYVPTPPTAGTWYAWVAGTDGSALTRYASAFTVA